jgi:hypothetical protein
MKKQRILERKATVQSVQSSEPVIRRPSRTNALESDTPKRGIRHNIIWEYHIAYTSCQSASSYTCKPLSRAFLLSQASINSKSSKVLKNLGITQNSAESYNKNQKRNTAGLKRSKSESEASNNASATEYTQPPAMPFLRRRSSFDKESRQSSSPTPSDQKRYLRRPSFDNTARRLSFSGTSNKFPLKIHQTLDFTDAFSISPFTDKHIAARYY